MWVGSYGRLSRALGDPNDPKLVAHQLEACDRWAAALGVTIPPERRISEVGSGERLAARPRFARQLEEFDRAPPAGGGWWFCTEVSRFTRAELDEVAQIIKILIAANVQPVIAGRPYNLADPNDWTVFVMQAVVAKLENDRYRQRTALVREKKFREGKLRNGKVPFGYHWNQARQRIEPEPEEFPRLVACCRDALTVSVFRLAEQHQVARRRLHTALTNPLICGYLALRYGPSRTQASLTVRPREQWQWPDVQSTDYPHACTRAEFERLQVVLAERCKRRAKTTGADGWCRDVVRFPDYPGPAVLSAIGRRIQRRDQPSRPIYERRGPCRVEERDKDGETRRVWLPGPRLAYIERHLVHAAAYQELVSLCADPAALRWMVAAYERHQHQGTAPELGAQQLAAQLTVIERQYEETVNAEYDAGEPLRSVLKRRRLRLEGERARLLQEQQTVLAAAVSRDSIAAALTELPALAVDFVAAWPSLPEKERRALVNASIERIDCRYERAAHGGAGRREVLAVVRQPWFRPQEDRG